MPQTLFSPPRNKPKLRLSQPTLAVGQPMPQVQTIPHPLNLVDDQGNVHGRIGENPNGPEQVTVTPPPGPTNDPAGGPNYASGGMFLVGGNPADTQEIMPSEGGGNPYTGTIGTGIFSPNWTPPVAAPAPSSNSYPSTINTGIFGTYQPQTRSPYPGPVAGNVNQELMDLQNQSLAAKRNVLGTTRNILDLRANTMPLRRAINQARGNVYNAQETQNQMERGVTQQRQQNDITREQELAGIYAASKNAPDIINTGEAENLYRAEDRRAAKMGVAPAATVNLPPDYNGPRLPGVRPKIMTQEQRLAEKAGYEDPLRNQKLQIAQDAVALQGSDVKAAELAANRAGLTLDEANQLVNEASLQQDYAQLFENQTGLNLAEAQQEPFPGAVRWTDPTTGAGQWVTPEQRDKLNIQYQESVTQPYQMQTRNQGAQNAGLSEAQLLNTIPKLAPGSNMELYLQPIRDELIRRYMQQGMTEEQATIRANTVIQQELGSRRGAGGGLLELNPGTTPAPAAAPTGTPTVTGPTLPAGYIP